MNKNKTMMMFFVASEAFFFIALIISYMYYSHPGGTLSETAKYLNITHTSIFTVFLISSSFTMEMAGAKLVSGQRKGMLIWLCATIIFGAVFLIGQMNEYLGLIKLDVTVSRDVFGSAFFTLTGFHGFHVFAGLTVLSIILGLIYSGNHKPIEKVAFKAAAIYWHFVDAVWIAVFSVVYLKVYV